MYQAACVLRQVPQPGKALLPHFIEGKLWLGEGMAFLRTLSGPYDSFSNPGLSLPYKGLDLPICTTRGRTSKTFLLRMSMPPLSSYPLAPQAPEVRP